MEALFYWHWFHSLKGIGQKEKEFLLSLCPEVREWFENNLEWGPEEVAGGRVYSEEQQKRWSEIQMILNDRDQKETARKTYEQIIKQGIRMTARGENDFPERLKQVYLSPFVLYYIGELPKDNIPSIGIVGARNCSIYGEEIAKQFGKSLSEAGIQIISGMARGIDGCAQRSAIRERGKSFAVFGSGVDVCYPSEHKDLYVQLCEHGGVISEELPGTKPLSHHFPRRNRIIAGLSDALFVVEAKEKSGSLITVSYALEQGKEIYAVPGRVHDRLADGTNRLIQEGAYLVREPEDILHNFSKGNFEILLKSKKNPKLLLETKEKIVYACLSLHPKHVEQISEETGMELSELASVLFGMEMKNEIRQTMKNYYMIQS
ncbi:MAG: DNA-protecting protein DprA [Lachnospiraceae bacterium]|nr:DNA-protecting protein DprA [Lachnospiraceae bacterium]